LDDAEFTAIANSGKDGTGPAFHGSFVNASALDSNYSDFYRTIVHEIGHALGIILTSRLSNMTTDIGFDPNNPGARLRAFNGPNGTVTFTELGGGHIYEGHVSDPPGRTSHPNDLMNHGRSVPGPAASPKPIIRQFISDLDAQILRDVYNYTVVLPSTFDTAHVTLDSQTGTLLVQGRIGWQDDMIITQVGNSGEFIEVQVNNTMERVLKEHVSQIVIAGHGNLPSEVDDIDVAMSLQSMTKQVHWVISSNQDALDPGTLGDVHVDLDSAVAGYQVSLRAAVQDANAGAGGWIYVPRGNYKLDREGSNGVEAGDLEITKSVIIVGSGAGSTIIDASGLETLGGPPTNDRIFDVQGVDASFLLDRVTLTGGKAPNDINEHGGAVIVRSGASFYLTESAVVDNAENLICVPTTQPCWHMRRTQRIVQQPESIAA
jgi:hypothetical protein